ncbi:putative two-component system sensor kinase [Actinoplanes missouriensis 431]|uniref:histidine kinase n=1 Tax=Actinoplanes missouriensis (strain ATCC 14538 / DSM 43046 / CBS 188.64 / JCM 3121 / NBRC 102363 / NCIMB 12654 / NRRL B-3342 / UNCC 431) TaxID=512565 RepID=I0H5D1_ACTM4|nr:HAMP domain-containing sensor histidine kinase [Actinoplanes missouriensis]BAL88218.1 putative two-component system sensor kinase [Actinoplanes missouriensis 431]
MRDILLIAAYALAAGAVVGLLGAGAMRLLRGRSITVHVSVLLLVTVAAVAAGVVAVAQAMFLSGHDLQVVLVTVAASAVVSLTLGIVFGRRLATAAVWAVQARERERRMEAGRRDLVAWVSHDLRTPLAGLRAMTEALQDGVVADPETVAEYHRRIRVETDRMSGLVDDLFELSRIHAGALRLRPAPLSLGDVVSDAVAAVAAPAAARRVAVTAGSGAWPAVTADAAQLSRIVGNLLANAVRHTPEDGVVRIDAGHDERQVWFAVRDGCGGIPDDDLPRVFDVAFRGSRARSPQAGGGGGLGLAIVHGLVQAHGGQVLVRNVAGGCRFEVRLPAGAGSA